MTAVALYPRLGATVLAEDSSVVPADGITATISNYYLRLLASGLLLTYDPRPDPGGVPTPLPAVGQGVPTFNTAASLGASKGAIADSVAITTGCLMEGDGGGGDWYWDPSDTTTPDNVGTVVGAGSGRWKRRSSGAVNVRWFGAKGDGVTNDNQAINAAISYALAQSQPPSVYVPSGDYVVNKVVVKTGLHLYGDGVLNTKIRAHTPLSDTGSESGILECDPNASQLHNLRLEGFLIEGGYSAWDPEVLPPTNQTKHGIYVHTKINGVWACRFRDLFIARTAGCGVRFSVQSYESEFKTVEIRATAGDNLSMVGGEAISFVNCAGGEPAADRAGLYIERGSPFVDAYNGLYMAYYTKPPGYKAPRVAVMEFGERGGSNFCRPTIVNSNIEEFTGYGLKFNAESFFSLLEGTSIIHSLPVVARAMKFVSVASSGSNRLTGRLGAAVRFFLSSGTWGNPVTQVTDGYLVESTGCPFVSDQDIPSFYDPVNLVEMSFPTRNIEYAKYATHIQHLRNTVVDPLFTTHFSPGTWAAVGGVNLISAADGNVAVVLPSAPGYNKTFKFVRLDNVLANTVTLTVSGGGTINGAASKTLTAQWESCELVPYSTGYVGV